MSDFEKFVNDELVLIFDFIKIVFIYYQFEMIYLFFDGNGRVGCLLIMFYFVSKGILYKFILYLLDFFEWYCLLYYDNFIWVWMYNDINQWYKFFLIGVIEIVKCGIKIFDGIFWL